MLMDERQPYVVEVDDETDMDVVAVLEDWLSPKGILMANLLDGRVFTHTQLQQRQHYHRRVSRLLTDSATRILGAGKQISVLRRAKMFGSGLAGGMRDARKNSSSAPEGLSLGSQLSRLFVGAYMQMCYNLRSCQPCVVLGLSSCVNLLDDDMVEVLLSGVCHRTSTLPAQMGPRLRMRSSTIVEGGVDITRASTIGSELLSGVNGGIGTYPPLHRRHSHSAPSTARARTSSAASENDSHGSGSNSLVGESLRDTLAGREKGESHSPGDTGTAAAAAAGGLNSEASSPAATSLASPSRRRRSLSVTSQGSNDTDSYLGSGAHPSARSLTGTGTGPMGMGSSPSSPSSGTFLRHFFGSGGGSDSVKEDRHYSASAAAAASSVRFRERGGEDGEMQVSPASVPAPVMGMLSAPALLDPGSVSVSPLSFVPGTVLTRYLGSVHLHMVKDSEITRAAGREEGATEQFFHTFLTEAGAMARAQVKALGGNALLAYKVSMQEGGRSSSNRGSSSGLYNMITISGDAVLLDKDESYCSVWQNAMEENERARRELMRRREEEEGKAGKEGAGKPQEG
jgi:hypothetical protein